MLYVHPPPKVLLAIPTTLMHGGLLEGLLGGLHCCSTYLKKKEQQGAVRAELFHEGEHLGAEKESSTIQTLSSGSLCHRGLSQEAEPWTNLGDEPGFRVQPRPPGDTGRERAGNTAGAQVDAARRQTQSKDWVPRAKQGCGFLVAHKDLKSYCRLEPRTPGSSQRRMVNLK